MIIHSYFTDGLYRWAVLFLKSFRKFHDEDIKIIFTTKDLDFDKRNLLKSLYPSLEIRNQQIDYQDFSVRTKKNIEEIKQMKHDTEHGSFSVLWKQFISVEDRYRKSIIDVIEDYIQTEHTHMLHLDIDMYFRGNIGELFKIIESNDISIFFRSKTDKKYKNECRRVLGSVIGFKLEEKIKGFMDVWFKHIDSIPLIEKPRAFGQTSFYRAFLETQHKFKFGNIPIKYSDPIQNDDAVIWAGNKGDKDRNLKLFEKHFIENFNREN